MRSEIYGEGKRCRDCGQVENMHHICPECGQSRAIGHPHDHRGPKFRVGQRVIYWHPEGLESDPYCGSTAIIRKVYEGGAFPYSIGILIGDRSAAFCFVAEDSLFLPT